MKAGTGKATTDKKQTQLTKRISESGFCIFAPAPNGLRYLRVGGRGQNSESRILFGCRKSPKMAQTPTRQVHALLGSLLLCQTLWLVKDQPANLTKFYNELGFLPKPKKETTNRNACYKKWVLRIKATNNQNANFGKPDFAQNGQRQRNRVNFTNSTYPKLCYKKTSRFWEPTKPTVNFAKRNRHNLSKPKLTKTQFENLETDFSDSTKWSRTFAY